MRFKDFWEMTSTANVAMVLRPAMPLVRRTPKADGKEEKKDNKKE